MKKGIVFVAFGPEYDKLAAHSARKSREGTNFPFHVITDVRERDRHPLWKEVTNVSFRSLEIEDCRFVRTDMAYYSPFEKTLMLDVDSFVRGSDEMLDEHVFDALSVQAPIIMNEYYHWEKGDRILNLYKEAMKLFKCDLPFSVWNGAIIAFQNTYPISQFFQRWRNYWVEFGKLRDMPCLGCAAWQWERKYRMKIGKLPDGFFVVDCPSEKCVVQHHWGRKWYDEVGMDEPHKNHRPKTYAKDFTWTDWP